MKLPPQAWQALPGAGAIMAALDVAAGTSRVVGGAVRDALIGLQVSDVDLATRLQPGEVVERLEAAGLKAVPTRSEEHTSELQSLMRISYAVFCLTKKKK